MDPIDIGKVLKEQNPFKYYSYTESIPSSRESSPSLTNADNSDNGNMKKMHKLV